VKVKANQEGGRSYSYKGMSNGAKITRSREIRKKGSGAGGKERTGKMKNAQRTGSSGEGTNYYELKEAPVICAPFRRGEATDRQKQPDGGNRKGPMTPEQTAILQNREGSKNEIGKCALGGEVKVLKMRPRTQA